jgi:hypothetical protein
MRGALQHSGVFEFFDIGQIAQARRPNAFLASAGEATPEMAKAKAAAATMLVAV